MQTPKEILQQWLEARENQNQLVATVDRAALNDDTAHAVALRNIILFWGEAVYQEKTVEIKLNPNER